MRKDMSKVIVERPRHGRSTAKMRPGRTRVLTDDDGAPLTGREPKAPRQKTKRLNENLSPLKRYLARNVERPWDKVYAEISEHLKPSSAVQQHVRDHLHDFVAIKTRMSGGKVMTTPRFGGERAIDDDHRPYFVHPRTGLLRKNENFERWSVRYRKKREAEEAELFTRMRVVDAKTQLHKLRDDVWYEVKLAKIGDGREPDVVLSAKLSALAPDTLYGREGMRAAAKHQLSKADKKKFGLD
jgi:hypothetical protein